LNSTLGKVEINADPGKYDQEKKEWTHSDGWCDLESFVCDQNKSMEVQIEHKSGSFSKKSSMDASFKYNEQNHDKIKYFKKVLNLFTNICVVSTLPHYHG